MKIGFDRPPQEGRAGSFAVSVGEQRNRELQWGTGDFSLWGETTTREKGLHSLSLSGSLRRDSGLAPAAGWIELETDANGPLEVVELFLVGTRPLPRPGITTVSRHPTRTDRLVLGTTDSRLLLVDAALTANLEIHAEITLPSAPLSIAPGGGLLLVLVKGEVLLYQANQFPGDTPAFSPLGSILLPVDLTALAENDPHHLLGAVLRGQNLPGKNPRLPCPILLFPAAGPGCVGHSGAGGPAARPPF